MGTLVRRYRFDIALVAALVLLELVGFGQDPGIGAASTLLELTPIVALLFRRRFPAALPVVFLLASVASAALDLHPLNSAAVVVAIAVGTYSAGAYLPLPWGLATLGLWWAAASVDFVAGREDGGATDLFFAWLILGWVFVPGAVVRRLREQADRAGREARDAAAREGARATEAVAAERARIARELHDVVAHAVSIMVVQAAAADEVLERDPARAHAALGAVQNAGRSAVREMSRMLDLLRGTPTDGLAPLPTLEGLPELAEEARLAGAEVVVERRPVGPLPPSVELCAFRVVQEALTNAAKHSRGPAVRVQLGCTDGMLEVLVEDDGGSGPRAGAGTGHGLLGLRERVEVFDGTLEAAPLPAGGFRVRALLPLGGTA